MIKLASLLKELDIQSKPELGSGEAFTAYPSKIDSSKVIKVSKYNSPEDIQYHANMFKKYPKYFPKVYKTTDKYMVIEKLNTKPIIKFYNKLKALTPYLNPLINIISYNPSKPKSDIYIDKVIKQYPELLDITLKLKKLYNTVDEILHNEGYDELDFHQGNIGIDDKGNFKMLDF